MAVHRIVFVNFAFAASWAFCTWSQHAMLGQERAGMHK